MYDILQLYDRLYPMVTMDPRRIFVFFQWLLKADLGFLPQTIICIQA